MPPFEKIEMSWAIERNNKTRAGSRADTSGLGRRPTYGPQIKPRNHTTQGFVCRYSVTTPTLPAIRFRLLPSPPATGRDRIQREMRHPLPKSFTRLLFLPKLFELRCNAKRVLALAGFISVFAPLLHAQTAKIYVSSKAGARLSAQPDVALT